MTRKCARCGAENLPEAKFCESCGFSMDASEMASGGPTRELSPRPGSLRDAIPFLTGGVDQAKARFDGWKQKKTRSETQKLREAHFEEQRELEEQQDRPKETFGRTVTRIVIGLLALALLIYIILRNPNLPPWMAQRMVNELLGTS
ncbi:MAG: zinc ribbon domain-containing protein [Vulcanimicrobiota bacterium]